MTRKFPNLDVVFDRGRRGGNFTEKRRIPRLSLSGEQFRLKQNGKIFSVADLSPKGMALRIIDRNDLVHFPIGAVVQGTLNIRREKFAAQGKVRHVKPDLVGFEFEFGTSYDATRAALETFLDPVALGQELRPIPSSAGVLWYHGPSGTDLLLWRAVDGQYTKMALHVLGSFVQWDSADGLSTGMAEPGDEVAEERGIVRLETMLLSADPAPDPGKLLIAKTVIMSSNLPQDLKKWCVRHLEFN